MRIIPTLKSILITLTVLLMASCSDKEFEENHIIHIEIKNTEEYLLDLGLHRMIDRPNGVVDADIILQANHFRKSELEFVVTGLGLNDNVIYKYLAEENFIGKDYVEINVCKSFECGKVGSQFETVKIEFIITN